MNSSVEERSVSACGQTGHNGEPDGFQIKEESLRQILASLGKVVVAYSGGVDSTYLALIATEVLGEDALCVTGDSASVSEIQRKEASDLASRFRFNHLTVATEEVSDPRYTENNPSRCYFCKSELFEKLVPIAQREGTSTIIDGSTLDDVGDYRPGRSAAAERGVRSPMIEAQMRKSDVRELSRRRDLPTWDRPASPCLSSRVAYGTPVTIERLKTVDRGEQILRDLGFKEFRVRHHDNLVRIEISPSELNLALNRDVVDLLAKQFRELGFRYVTLDLHGFRSGAMNEILNSNS